MLRSVRMNKSLLHKLELNIQNGGFGRPTLSLVGQ